MDLHETNRRERIYNLAMKIVRFIVLVAVIAVATGAQGKPRTPPAAKPALTKQMVLPSHGGMLLGIFYLAAGAGPHPTAVLFSAFPAMSRILTSRSSFAPTAGMCWPCITAVPGERKAIFLSSTLRKTRTRKCVFS